MFQYIRNLLKRHDWSALHRELHQLKNTNKQLRENLAVFKGTAVDSNKLRGWSKAVRDRDKICKACSKDKFLQAHHIWDKKTNPSLRYQLDNGITLCSTCHAEYHLKYESSIPSTLNKFIAVKQYEAKEL